MRDHIRREAAQFTAGWWLVPVAFAVAAFVAVASGETDAPQPLPAPQAVPPALPVATQPAPPAAQPFTEATEHIQAF